MKKQLGKMLLAGILTLSFIVTGCAGGGGSKGKIKVGVVNNPPSESGYREANVKDMESVFSDANGYELKRVQPCDMFGHSVHVETVVLMERVHD